MSTVSSLNQTFVSVDDIKSLIIALDELIQDDSDVSTDGSTNSSQGSSNPEVNVFSVGKIPKITLMDYFARITKYCKLQLGSFIAMMIYLDKAAEKIELSGYNIHRLILGALVCGIKYTCDVCNNNIFFARVGGITPQEMCIVENSFLEVLDYSLYISEEEYEKYLSFLN